MSGTIRMETGRLPSRARPLLRAHNNRHRHALAHGCYLLLALAAAGCGRTDDAALSLGAPTPLEPPSAEASGQPHLASGPEGRVVLSWLEEAGSGHALRYSVLTEEGWSSARTVAQGERWFVNWADLPSVVPITPEVWAAHWLVLVPGSLHAYDIMVALSNDAGETWGEAFKLNDDKTETEHGFASLFRWGEDIGAVWLDGRAQAEVDWAETAPQEPPPGVALRHARLTHDAKIIEQEEIDPLVCECCQTDVAVAAGGPVLAYRNRTPTEIRDITVRRADEAWAEAVGLAPDNWHLTGCPVNGPAVAASNDTVAVAWFTGAGGRQRVRLAYSRDSGRSFEPSIEVDGAAAFGYVGVVLLEGGDSVVSWWRRSLTGAGVTLAARRVSRDGTLGATHVITTRPDLRPIDVPQMVRSGNRLVFAWTDPEHGVRSSTSRLLH